MYFAIIGHHESIHLHALSYLHPSWLTTYKKHIVFFHSDFPERFASCAGTIKRGHLTDDAWLAQAVQDAKIVAVHSNDMGKELKKRFAHIKKYKVIDLLHTDQEVKEEGKEVISFGNQWRGVVTGYQDIKLYEIIDFDKPCRGMEVGMMPAKLALSLINIAVGEYEKQENKNERTPQQMMGQAKDREIVSKETKSPNHQNTKLPTIRDPFVWFGTTSFLSHFLSYPSIASDINITNIKNNLSRREKARSLLLTDSPNKIPLTVRKHDVTESFDDPVFAYADCIVSEWYLGHVVTHRTHHNAIRQWAAEIEELYIHFCTNLTKLSIQHPKTRVLVMTIPVWIYHDYSISEKVKNTFSQNGRSADLLPDIYSRSWQMVGRQVLIARRD